MVLELLIGAALNIGARVSQAFGGGGGGTMKSSPAPAPSNNGSVKKSSGSKKSSSGGGGGSSGDAAGEGSEGGSGDVNSTDNTAQNVLVNDPEKNKLLAEVRMMEELRETLEITFRIPRILKGLHTNSWFFIDVTDGFYEQNYGLVMKVIAEKKYGRYAGFQEGRFFVEKIVEKGGVDGVSMEITVNPLASNYSQYVKMQLEAEKALVDALNDSNSYANNGASGTGGSINSSDIIGIGNELASKYKFCSGAAQSYADMKKSGCGSCFAWSGALYTELTAKGYQCRVIQYATSQAGNHRSVQINNNGVWEDYPYRSTNIPRNARNTSSKPGMFVISESTLKSIL